MYLMFKKKDRRDIANYRPITLLNTDYKLQTGAMAQELGKHVNNMLHPDQAGFVPGRDILDHVRLAQATTHACELEEIDGCLVALDQEKAYDKIDHAYLWRILAAFGLPETWINTVKTLYGNAMTTVMLNQMTPRPFRVERGVRQGDPLSCLLFDLAIEPLAESLRRSDLKGIRIPGTVERLLVRLFADDTQLYLGSQDKWTEVTKITDKWCLASTAKFNQEKTEIMPMGSDKYKEGVTKFRTLQPLRIRTQELLPRGAAILNDKTPMRILGGLIGTNLDREAIWEKTISTMEDLTAKWSKRSLTLKGRKLIASFIIQSRAQYLMMTNDPPEGVIQRIEKATHRLMWKGKKRGLTKMTELYKDYDSGGLGVPCFKDKAKAARLIWAKKWLSPVNSRPLWSDLVDRMIAVTAKGKPDARRASILTQTWEEKKGPRSNLPHFAKLMVKEARNYGVKIDAQKFSGETKAQAPAWLSRMTELTPREEGRAAMKHLRVYHRVETLGDLKRLCERNNEGCKHHLRCMQAVDLLTIKTRKRFNIRAVTPMGEDGPIDNLDLTARRKSKAELDWHYGRAALIDPSVTHRGDIRGATRVFTKSGREDLPPANRNLRNQAPTPEIVVYTDGSAMTGTNNEPLAGAGIWSDHEDLTKALKVPGLPQTNNRGELAAITWALAYAPKDAPLLLKSDSTYVINGLIKTHKAWEDAGWLNVENADLWKLTLQEMRIRKAETRVMKVKAHSNIHGNEEADRLARQGCTEPPSADLDIELLDEWQASGARLSNLTFKMAYKWIRHLAGASSTAPRAKDMLSGAITTLAQLHQIQTSEKDIWRSLRTDSVRREIADFLWLAIHQRSPCGAMFSKWGGEWEDLQYCECGEVETMRHILTECDLGLWRRRVWQKADTILIKSGHFPKGLEGNLSLEEIISSAIPRSKNAAANRLYTTVVTEAAFAIWKVRNRARFDNITPNQKMATEVFTKALEIRATRDLSRKKLRGPKTAPDLKKERDIALAWSRVIALRAGVAIWFPSDYG